MIFCPTHSSGHFFSVVDQNRLCSDLDPDPDPASHVNLDSDPDPGLEPNRIPV